MSQLNRYNSAVLSLAANTIRVISAEAVQKANSGHPGMPMGMAECALALWLNHLRFNPAEPKWIDRDRFVLSNGHGSMLLYSMLHLCGYDLSLDDIKQFRQWHSKTPGHPESFITPGVECTTGPLGQGIGNAVGMALGQKLLAEKYSPEIFSHRVYCFAGDGCMMEGISSEASSFAGHLGLGNLVVVYDDNQISIAGRTNLAFSEDVGKRYEAYGWHVQHVDGHDIQAVDNAIQAAKDELARPSLICARTIIGKGSPNKADSAESHGSPLGAEEVKLVKKELGWEYEEEFYVPAEVRELFATRLKEVVDEYANWYKSYQIWREANSSSAESLANQLAGKIPADLEQKILAAMPTDNKPIPTRKLSSIALQVISKEVPALIGGSADLEPSTLTVIKDSMSISREDFSGKNIHFGVREHAMGAIMNGLAYTGGFIPYGSTFLVFSDYMRPAIRLAALSKLPCLFIFTHDSVFLGEDGPTHQPIEHINSLRMIPNLHVFRPANARETAVCYAQALARLDGPSAIMLSRQNVSAFDSPSDDIVRGAYTVYENSASSVPEIVLVATGSEVSLALESAKEFGSGKSVRVVSMPCAQLFLSQDKDWKRKLIPSTSKVFAIEAGHAFVWQDLLVDYKHVNPIGINGFGASAPSEVIADKFGFSSEQITQLVNNTLGRV